jgi:hypothetical protein
MLNLCFKFECTISRHQSCEASILLHWTQNDMWECYRALCSPSTCKKTKTCVSGLNALLRGTKVEKHPFYSLRPKMMFGSVMEHFANLVHVKRWNLVFRSWMHYFAAPKLRSIDSTPFDQKWYMGALRSTSLTLYENLCFGPECTIAGYQSWEASILLH